VTTVTTNADAEEAAARLAERIFHATNATWDIAGIYIGDRLGLYAGLAGGPATSVELAERTGTHERYVREWLEQQAVTGILAVDDVTAASTERRYALPPGHGETLLDRDSLNYLSPLARGVIGVLLPLPRLLEVFRSGGGVPYEDFGPDTMHGIADMNRPMFVNLLGSEWLPGVPEVDARLRATPPARVADLGCGAGWSTISIARAYPGVAVDGFDLDEASIAQARRNAEECGVADRVRFVQQDASDPDLAGTYDLVTIFEAVHDMARPVDALRTARRISTGALPVIVADERVADAFTAPGDDTERFMYGWSILHCLTVGMVEHPSACTGTVMRADTLRAYAREAGFASAEPLEVWNDFWRLYRLDV
jgi:2-polyprenyl-3-methyl-5-hydroxy-6-metoxy-1,4-benzoquinol methylase